MEIKIVEFIQSLASPFFDVLFWCITKLGEEGIFLLVFALIYLCYNKKFALKLMLIYLVSVGINSVVKTIINRPRPYVTSNSINNRLPADGSSMPSGHAQGYSVWSMSISYEFYKNSPKKSLAFFVVMSLVGIFVMISRLYWGQHYLSDVFVGMLLGVVVAIGLSRVIDIIANKVKRTFDANILIYVLGLVASVLFIFFLIIELVEGFDSAKVYKFLGVFVALAIGVFVDNKWIKYKSMLKNTKQTIVKYVVTIITLLGLYFAVELLFDIKTYLFFVVYLFLGLVCTIILPLLYKRMFKRGQDEEIGS